MGEDEKIEMEAISIDKDGRWFYQGSEMIHRDIVLLFYQHLHIDSQGRYLIRLAGEECYVKVEDTAFAVLRIDLKTYGNREECFRIWLNDESEELLDLDALFVGKENVLYCKVKGGKFPARFQRPAYYQLAKYVQEEDGKYLIVLNGRKHLIHHVS